MINVNEYFDGNVKSLAFENAAGKATAGVMVAGEYEFGTSTVEHMTVTAGALHVQMPGETSWTTYKPHETFRVESGIRFKVKTEEPSSYICYYE
jgi:hypothetical protein